MSKKTFSIKKETSRWIIDRRIPIALILAIFMQIGGMLVWAASLEARVKSIEIYSDTTQSYGEKLARIEERLEHTKQDTEAIKRQLSYLTNRLINK